MEIRDETDRETLQRALITAIEFKQMLINSTIGPHVVHYVQGKRVPGPDAKAQAEAGEYRRDVAEFKLVLDRYFGYRGPFLDEHALLGNASLGASGR